jgi:hypothetical protein
MTIPAPKEFAHLDRLARLNILREVQHHSGIESDEYRKLARAHEYALLLANGGGPRRPLR